MSSRFLLTLIAAISLCARATQAQTSTTPLVLSLGDAARLAAKQSLATQAALLRADAADTRVTQRRADLLPTFSGTAETNSRSFNTATLGLNFPSAPGQAPFFDPDGQVIGPVPTTDFRLHLQQNIYDPAINARLKLARQQSVATRTEATEVGEASAAQAAVAYVRALRAAAVLDARAADSVLAADLSRIARETLRAGTGVALDVTRAESQLVVIRSQLIAARAERDRAMLDLQRALNVSYDARVQLTDVIDADDADAPTATVAFTAALKQRPELAVLDAQISAAQLSERAARAERLPSISAIGDDGFIGKSVANPLNTWTWGVRVSVPAFDGGRRSARIREQGTLERELGTRRSDIVAQVGFDVRSALLDAAATRDAVAAARERLALGEQEVSQARDRFTTGVSGNLDVIQALLGLSAARSQLVDALSARQLARIAIARAQGALLSLR